MLNLHCECWVITDASAGNQRQALALAEHLQMPLRHLVLQPRAPWSWLAPRLELAGRFALSATAEGPQVVIRAEDSGAGMPPDVVQQMFEPFFTTKAKDEGTGIGMTIVHRFVVDSGGTIAVDSEPGRGTRIEIRLPLADTPRAGEAPDR